MGLYPEPNITTAGSVPWQNNFFLKDNVTWYDFHNIVDAHGSQLREKERVYGRYVWNDQLLHQDTNGLPGYAADLREGHKINNGSRSRFPDRTQPQFHASTSAGLHDPLGAGLQAQQLGRLRRHRDRLVEEPGQPLQEPQPLPVHQHATAIRRIGPSASNIWLAPTTTIAIAPTLTTIRGRHALKFGLDYRWTRYANYQSTGAGGNFAFDRGFTRSNYLTQDSLSGNAIASAAAGRAASGRWITWPAVLSGGTIYAPWVQDDIKLTRRLTINVGLRWDLLVPVTEKYDRINRGFFATR